MTKLCQLLLRISLAIIVLLSGPTAIITTTTVDAAKILGLFAHPSESHFGVMRSVMMELARRGHNVTVYSSHRLSERVDQLQEVIIEPEFPFWSELQKTAGATNKGGLLALSRLPAASLRQHLAATGAAAVDYFLSSVDVQKLLQLPPASFDYDLIIVDLFYTEALLAFGHVHATPTVGIVSTDFANYMWDVVESVVPVACSPIDFASDSSGSSSQDGTLGYWQRLANIRSCMARRKQFAKSNMAAQQQLIQKHFTQFKASSSPPTIPQLQSELAVLLLNNHIPLATPRPLLQNTIAVGGLHIRPPRELPWHIRRFLDESRSGVIYMNLGNEQLCGSIPQNKLRTLFQVLGKYKEHVLWTCHDVEQLDGLPKNFMLQHAVPQTDILAHPHVKVFVMNGDLLALQEGIVRHVPMLGIPIFANEVSNMALAVRLGVGVQLAYSNLTEVSLTWALQALMYNADYAVTIRSVASAFRERPLGALESAMYWVEYVLRHNGGAALKTHGVGLPSSQLHLFDLFVFYFAVAIVFVGVLVGVYFVAQMVWQRQQTAKMYSKLN